MAINKLIINKLFVSDSSLTPNHIYMDPQDNQYPSLNFSRTFSIQNLTSSAEMFFDKSRKQLKQTNSPSKKTKLDAILSSLRAFKSSQSTTDLHSGSQVSQKFINKCDQSTKKEDESLPLNKKSSSNFIEGRESIKKSYCMNSPSKKYLQTFKKEENSYSHQMKHVLSENSLKRVKQSQIIMSKNNDDSGHQTSKTNFFEQKSPGKKFCLELQKSSLEAIKEKLQKYGINTSKKQKDQSQSRLNLNKSQKYPETKKTQKSFQDLRLASSGQFSPALIKGIKDKLREQELEDLKQNSFRPLTRLKQQNLAPCEKFPDSTTLLPKNNLTSVKTSIIENEKRVSLQKNTESNSVNSTTIHAKCFNFNMENFAGMKFRVEETIGPKKPGSYGNQKTKSSEQEENGTVLKQKHGSWGHKKCFKSDFEQLSSFSRSSNLNSFEKHDFNLKQTIETNCTVEKLERKLTFKDFILGRQIGKGKFGRVYICTHRQSGFLCAMKIIKKDMIRKQRSIEQLIRQIKIQMYLNHSNSVKMYAFFYDSQNIYLLMEYCIDGQLYALLKIKKKFEEDEAIPIIKDICEGLNHLHEQNIIHRDIKPENVVLSFQLSKLCDFGWSVNSQNQKRETFCGTPLYVSPELLMGKTYDYKVDIWALGIMVYELLTGKLPFQITNEKELRKIVTSEVKYPEHLSENAKNFIQHLLQKNPSYRNNMETILKHKFLVEGMEKCKPKPKSG